MAFSGGTYTLPGPALVTGEIVSATENNQLRNDMAASFNLTMLRNGTSTATANLPMGGYKLTGLGVATTSGDALSYGQAAVVSDFTATGAVTVNSGTANGVAYLNGSKVLTTGSALTFDGSKLTVKGGNAGQFVLDNSGQQYVQQLFKINGADNSGADFLFDGTNSVFNIRTLAVAPIAFSIATSPGTSTEQMRLTSTGLGIGTSSPQSRLEVRQDQAGAITRIIANNNNATTGSGSSFDYYFGTTRLGGITHAFSGNAYLGFDVWSGSAATERMRIDSSGNVGIGTSSPTAYTGYTTVEAKGKSGGASGLFKVTTSDAAVSAEFYATSGTGAYLYTTTANPLLFGTNGSERMRIDSSGNLLVGTTSSLSGNSNCFVTAGAASSDVAVFARSTTNSANVRCVIAQANNYAGDAGYFFIGSRSTGDRFYVLTSGNVQNSNNSYGGISDIKVKENITDATPKLEKLQQVRVVNYNLIGESHKQIGVIAQELEPIFPGMIEETQDRDSEGNALDTTTKSVKYSVFVPMLIKAIQELKAELDATKAEVAALKGA